MSTQTGGGARGRQSNTQNVAPYVLRSLLRNIPLTEDGDSPEHIHITCVDFWNSNLYIGTSNSEILHYVLLPPASEDEAEDPTFILASRLQPEFSPTESSQSGIQQIVLLPSVGKACVVCNSTLTFYSLPELSPAYGGSVKVGKCAWITVAHDERPLSKRADDGVLLMICVDRRMQLVRIGETERPKRPKTIDLAGSVNAECSGHIACVANKQAYSLLDITEQQQIPLFDINPQSDNDPEQVSEKELPSPPTSSERSRSEREVQPDNAAEATGPSSGKTDDAATGDDGASEDAAGAAFPPRSSSLEPSSAPPEQASGSARKSTEPIQLLKPNISIVTTAEFLLTTGTSKSEPGVGIFVNHDGDVVRGTLQFSKYPDDILVDLQNEQSATQVLPDSPFASSLEGYVLAVVDRIEGDKTTKQIEIQQIDAQSKDNASPYTLDPRNADPPISNNGYVSTLGLGRSTSSQEVVLPEIVERLRPKRFDLTAQAISDEGESDAKRPPSVEQELEFVQKLSRTPAQSLMFTNSSVWWMARTSPVIQLDDQLNSAIYGQVTEMVQFIDRNDVGEVLSLLRVREEIQNTLDELTFLTHRYLRQKASVLLFYDLVHQTAGGNMTYERDRELTEQVLAEGDVDPRVLIAAIRDLRTDIKVGESGMWLQSGVDHVWQLFRQCSALNTSVDPKSRSWQGLLQMLKRYLLRWRRKRGYGSVADDKTLFACVDFALLQILLTLDSTHPRGRASKGSARAELNALVDEGVECFDDAVELLEKQHRLYILSRLHQGRRQYGRVLETWKRIVEGPPDAGGELGNGEDEIRDYLTKRKDKALIQEYGTWLAARNPGIGVRVFADPKSQVRFDPREVVDLLKEHAPNAVKEYLEQLVFGNNLPQYANDLIGYYLDSVLEELQSSEEARAILKRSYETYRALTAPKPAYSLFATDNAINAAWWQNRLRLLQLLGGSHAAASQYDTGGILARIEPFKDLLVPETIILGGRQGRHSDAIRLLVHGLGDFDTAVSYCVLGGAGTYGAIGDTKGQPTVPSHEQQAQLFRELLQEFLAVEDLNARIVQTGELLGRFSRWFTIEEVLSTIPENWAADRVSAFFESALRLLQSDRCEQLVLRALTSSENLSSSAQVVEKIESLGAVLRSEGEQPVSSS